MNRRKAPPWLEDPVNAFFLAFYCVFGGAFSVFWNSSAGGFASVILFASLLLGGLVLSVLSTDAERMIKLLCYCFRYRRKILRQYFRNVSKTKDVEICAVIKSVVVYILVIAGLLVVSVAPFVMFSDEVASSETTSEVSISEAMSGRTIDTVGKASYLTIFWTISIIWLISSLVLALSEIVNQSRR